jgi:hypothetical protein
MAACARPLSPPSFRPIVFLRYVLLSVRKPNELLVNGNAKIATYTGVTP